MNCVGRIINKLGTLTHQGEFHVIFKMGYMLLWKYVLWRIYMFMMFYATTWLVCYISMNKSILKCMWSFNDVLGQYRWQVTATMFDRYMLWSTSYRVDRCYPVHVSRIISLYLDIRRYWWCFDRYMLWRTSVSNRLMWSVHVSRCIPLYV